MKTAVTIIPARGGSKGVPRKNIRLLGGKPLIYYSVQPSLECEAIQHTFVSTEDEEIAQVARDLGAKVIHRPMELADDVTGDIPVLQHAIEYMESDGIKPDLIVFLRPTQPFRTVEDIQQCIQKSIETGARSVHTVHEAKEHPFWMNKLVDGRLVDFVPGGWEVQRRQDLPKVYKSNGLVDVMTRDLVMEGKKRCNFNQQAVVTPVSRGIDIDTEFDLKKAEIFLQEQLK